MRVFKLFIVFITVFLATLLLNVAYANTATPELSFHELKNMSKTAQGIKTDMVFRSVANPSNYYIKPNVIASWKALTPIARRRIMCATPASTIACAVGSTIAYKYFTDELGLRDFDFDADTNSFVRNLPNGYTIAYRVGGKTYATLSEVMSAGSAQVQGFIRNEMDNKQKATVERYASSASDKFATMKKQFEGGSDYYTLGMANYTVYMTNQFDPNQETFRSQYFDVVAVNTMADGVEYDEKGKAQGSEVVTPSQLDTMIEGALADAPASVHTDLLTSSNYIAEGHGVIAGAVPSAVPYNPASGEVLEAQPDGEVNPYAGGLSYTHPDTGVKVEVGAGAGTGETTVPDTGVGDGTGAFGLPSFCSWASPVCDFIDWVKSPFTPDTDTKIEIMEQTDRREDVDVKFVGSCPPDMQVPIKLGSIGDFSLDFSFLSLCGLLETIRPFVIVMATLSYVFIVSAGSRT